MKRLILVLLLIGLSAGAYLYFHPGEPGGGARKEPRLAKQGTLFLVDYVSIQTPHGVIGLEPGQEVHFVRADRTKGVLVVSDGTYEVEVPPGKLTNDLDTAALARKSDEDSQRQLSVSLAAQKAANERVERAADIRYAQELDRIRKGAPGSPPPHPVSSSPNSGLNR